MSRIVSLVPSVTELVCELGLADQLVGRTGFCIHPAATLKGIPKVGGTKSVNLRKVRSLGPTHVIVNVDENTKQTADALAEFVPNLIVTHPLAPEDNLALYRQIGAAFERKSEAEALCRDFEEVFLEVRRKDYPTRRVIYLIWKDPWMTVSRDTYISRTLAAFGMQTLPEAADTRYPKFGLDEPWVADAERILVSTEPYRFVERHLAEIGSETGKPAKLIDGEMTSWYGSRAIRALRYLSDYATSL